MCLLLFQISCGGKSCALFWTGEDLNDESSFDLTNNNNDKKKNNSKRLHTGFLCHNAEGSEAASLQQDPVGQAEQRQVMDERLRGSVAEVCVCLCGGGVLL